MLRNAQRLCSRLAQAESLCSTSGRSSSSSFTSSDASSSSGGGGSLWAALRSISSSACAQRKLFPAADPVRADEAAATKVDRPYLVDKYLSPDVMSAGQQRRLALRDVAAEFQRFAGDTGSTEVQVALLTERIRGLAEHMRQHRKDYSSRRGLEALLTQRRTLLQYLRRSAFDKYAVLISRLGLKDSYGPQDRFSARYKAAAAVASKAAASSAS